MVVSTLNGHEQQQSCPILFLPNLCFDTWSINLFGTTSTTIRVNVAPLVQLIVVQVMLPRVSFTGHLAGIIVGFLWPFLSLEWMQPSILYPVLWISCKYYYYYYYYYTSCHSSYSAGGAAIMGASGGDGETTQSNVHHRCWENTSSSHIHDSFSFAATVKRLAMLRNILVVHWICHSQQFGLFGSGTISELLLLAILCQLVKCGRQQQQQDKLYPPSLEGHDRHPLRKKFFGIVGRGYICLAFVSMVTDGLTLGGWLVTWSLWSKRSITIGLLLLLFRNAILLLSMALTVHGLVLLYDKGGNSAVTSSSGAGGTFSIFVWPLVSPFQPLGKWLQELGICSGSRWHDADNLHGTCQQLQPEACFGTQEGGREENSGHPPGSWVGNRFNETSELV